MTSRGVRMSLPGMVFGLAESFGNSRWGRASSLDYGFHLLWEKGTSS